MMNPIQLEIRPLTEDNILRPFEIKASEKLIESLGLKPNQTIHLNCSRYSCQVQLVSIKERDLIMYCSKELLQTLHLPNELPFFLSITQEKRQNHFTLGPIVSVLTEISDKGESVSMGSISDFCEELAKYCAVNGIFFFVFSLKDWNTDSMQGYIFQNKKWIKTRVPHPQVIHNRIHSRKREQSDAFKRFTDQLSNMKIPYFNDHFLNKWEVHEYLITQEHLTPFIPDTKILLSMNILEEMLVTHECIFLKPIHGSQGRKIFRITKHESDYLLDYTSFSGEIEQKYDSIRSLFQSLRSRLNQQAFIAQQGLPLLKYNDRPLDFRILCHKTNENKWKITSAIARVSSKEQFVSNLARGGELVKLNTILSTTFDSKRAVHIKKLMMELALEVAESISLTCQGIYGELGIDLALDMDGKPWVIEVNTKPSKDQDPDHLSSKVRPSAKAIIQHCLFLANYPHKE